MRSGAGFLCNSKEQESKYIYCKCRKSHHLSLVIITILINQISVFQGGLWRGNSTGIYSQKTHSQCFSNARLLLEIPRLTDLQANLKFPTLSLGCDISLQRLNSHVHSLIVQRRMTLRMGIKEEEITFIKKFRFPPSF